MPPRCLPALLLTAVVGCLTPVTDRIDRTNRQVELSNQQLMQMSQQLDQSNRKVQETNRRLEQIAGEIRATNRRLDAIEKSLPRLPRLPGLGGNITEPGPAAKPGAGG